MPNVSMPARIRFKSIRRDAFFVFFGRGAGQGDVEHRIRIRELVVGEFRRDGLNHLSVAICVLQYRPHDGEAADHCSGLVARRMHQPLLLGQPLGLLVRKVQQGAFDAEKRIQFAATLDRVEGQRELSVARVVSALNPIS